MKFLIALCSITVLIEYEGVILSYFEMIALFRKAQAKILIMKTFY